MTRDVFLARWRARLGDYRRIPAWVDGAKLCEELLSDFELLSNTESDALVDLARAAADSGYSPDHLRRLAREKKLPVQRRGRSLWFRSGDLPKKPPRIAPPLEPGYDAIADARRVVTRRHQGGAHG